MIFGNAGMYSFCAELPMRVLKSILWMKWSISLWCCYGMHVGVSFRQYKFVTCNVYQYMEEMEYRWQLYPAAASSASVPNVCSALLLWYQKFSLESPQQTPHSSPMSVNIWGVTYVVSSISGLCSSSYTFVLYILFCHINCVLTVPDCIALYNGLLPHIYPDQFWFVQLLL